MLFSIRSLIHHCTVIAVHFWFLHFPAGLCLCRVSYSTFFCHAAADEGNYFLDVCCSWPKVRVFPTNSSDKNGAAYLLGSLYVGLSLVSNPHKTL